MDEDIEELAQSEGFQDRIERVYDASSHIRVAGYLSNEAEASMLYEDGVETEQMQVLLVYGIDEDGEPIAVTLFFDQEQSEHLFGDNIDWGVNQ